MRKLILSILLMMSCSAFSQGFQVNLQGQKQIAMGGAGTGTALDEAAVFYNPGAVSMLTQNGIELGANALMLRTAFRDSSSQNVYYNKNQIATPLSGYAVFGSSKRVKFGFGIYTPFGGLMKWDNRWIGRYVITAMDLKTIYIQPTVSIKLSDYIGLGVGIVHGSSRIEIQRGLPIAFASGQIASGTLQGSAGNWGWNAGLFIKTPFGVSIGLSHRSKVIEKIKEGGVTSSVPASITSLISLPSKFSTELPLPATTSIGIGFGLSAKTHIAFDVNWVYWHIFKNLNIQYDDETTMTSPRNYHDATALRLGIENQINTNLTWRSGIGYAFSPVPDGYVTPDMPDANRLLLSAGLGYQINPNFHVDASFLWERLQPRTQTHLESNLSGTFKSLVYVPGVSLTYNFK